ncbi:hypothetical protein MMC29_000765 [Sticta canariensis]|nr:hypothetical protein [Sticta canariensis]
MDHYLLAGSYYQTSLIVILAAVVFEIFKVVYRLYLAPLAGFPGPKLAAVTTLYAAYYDLFCGGSFIKKLPALHKQYGPVVRILPGELHIQDLESYHKIFKVGTPFDKRRESYSSPAIKGSLVAILGTAAAIKRRDAYNHHFSKLAIRRAEGLIQAKISQLVDRFRSIAKENRPVDLTRGYRCLTADIITEYIYQEDFGGLSSKDFRHPLIEACDTLFKGSTWSVYFRRTFAVLDRIGSLLSDRTLAFLSPSVSAIKQFQARCAISIKKLKQRSPSSSNPSTMFDVILNLGKNESKEILSESDLTAEAVLMLLAGMDTTANALVVGTWGILQNEEVHKKLQNELYQAIPHNESTVNADMLDKLPYLTGVVKESLRLSYGSPGQLARVVPSSGTTILGRHIPAGTILSLCNYVYNTNEAIFPDAQKFLPDRWLQPNVKELEQNMHSFSRGSRACLGMHLANDELFLTFARMFRTFEPKIFETTQADMEWGSYGVPVFKGHLKAMMHEVAT